MTTLFHGRGRAVAGEADAEALSTPPRYSRWTGHALSVYRIAAGLVYMGAGTMKLFGWPPPPMGGPVPLGSELGVAAILETFGGLAIVLGLLTRPIAFVLAGEMAIAYFQVHAPKGFFPLTNGGIAAVLFCFLYLYLAFAGAGPWSLDAWLQRRRLGR